MAKVKGSKKVGAGGASGGDQAAAASSSSAAASTNDSTASEFKVPRKKKRPAPTTPNTNNDEPTAKAEPEKLKAAGGPAASTRTSASGPSRKRSRTTSPHGTSRNSKDGGNNNKAANSKQSGKAAGKRAKKQSSPGIRPGTDRGNAHPAKKGVTGKRKAAAKNRNAATGSRNEGSDGGVLLGHRILKPFPHVRRVKRGKKYVEEDCEALFLGTVVKYHRPADTNADSGGGAAAVAGKSRGRGRPAKVLVAKRIAADGTRTDKDMVYRDDKGPLDVGLYRVRFDDGDVSDLEPTEIYAGAVLYQKERARRLAAAGSGGELTIIVGCCAVVAPHHVHQPSEESGVKSLLNFANPPMDYGTAPGRQIVAALDEEMQAYWEAYESFHREEGIKRPALLSKRAKKKLKSVGWGWGEGGGDDDDNGNDNGVIVSSSIGMMANDDNVNADAAEGPVPSSSNMGEDSEQGNDSRGVADTGTNDTYHESDHIEEEEDDSVDGGSDSHSHARAEERVMSQDLLPKELREEDHAVVIVEGPRKRKKTAAYSDTTPEDPACWNSLVRAHENSDDGGASDGSGNGGGGRRRPAPLSIAKMHQLSKVVVGCRISILWPADNEYYPGKVTGRDPESNRIFRVMYDDGECETLDLGKEQFRILKEKKRSNEKRKMPITSDHGEEDSDGGGNGTNDDIVCPFCTKAFKKTSGLSSHLNTCNVKMEMEAEIEDTVAAASDDDSNKKDNARLVGSKGEGCDEETETKKKIRSKPRKPERRRMASANKITPQAIIQDGKLMAMRASMPRKRKQTKPYTDDSPVDEACAEALIRHHRSSDEDSDSSSNGGNESGNCRKSDSEIEVSRTRRSEGVKGATIGKKSLPSESNRDGGSDASDDGGGGGGDGEEQTKLHSHSSAIPSDDSLRRSMKELMFVVDLNTITSRQFISKLSEFLGGIDLSSKKVFIKDTLTNMVIDMDVGGVKSAAAASKDDSINTQQRVRKVPPSLGKQPRFRRDGSNGGDGAGAAGSCGDETGTSVQGDRGGEENSTVAVGGASSVAEPRQRDVKWMSVRYFSESGETDSDEDVKGERGNDSGQLQLSANDVDAGNGTASYDSGDNNDIIEEKKEETDSTRITEKDVSSGSDGEEESGLQDCVDANAAESATEPGPPSQSEQIDDNDKEGMSIRTSAKSNARDRPSREHPDTAANDAADATAANLVQNELKGVVEGKDYHSKLLAEDESTAKKLQGTTCLGASPEGQIDNKTDGDEKDRNESILAAESPTGTGALGDVVGSTAEECLASPSNPPTAALESSSKSAAARSNTQVGQVNAESTTTTAMTEEEKKKPVAESADTPQADTNTKTKGAPDASTEAQCQASFGVDGTLSPTRESAESACDTEKKADSFETEAGDDDGKARTSSDSLPKVVPPPKPTVLSTGGEPLSQELSSEGALAIGITKLTTADKALGASKSSNGSVGEQNEAAGQQMEQISPSAGQPSRDNEELKGRSIGTSTSESPAVDSFDGASGFPSSQDENKSEQAITGIPRRMNGEDNPEWREGPTSTASLAADDKADGEDKARRNSDVESTREESTVQMAGKVASAAASPGRKSATNIDEDSSRLVSNVDTDSIPRGSIKDGGGQKEEVEKLRMSTSTAQTSVEQAQDDDEATAKVTNLPTDPDFFERETPPIETPTSGQDRAIGEVKLSDDVSSPMNQRPTILPTGPESAIPTSQDGASNGAREEDSQKDDTAGTGGAEKNEGKSKAAPGLDTDLKQSLSQLDDLLAFDDGDEDEDEEEEEEESKVDTSLTFDGDETPKRSGSSPTFSTHDTSEEKGKMPLQPAMGVSTHDKREASESDIRNAERAAEDAINHRLDSSRGQSIKRGRQNGSLGASDRPNPLAKRSLSEELSVEGDEGESERRKGRVSAGGAKEKKKYPSVPERRVDDDSSSGEEEVLDEGAAAVMNNDQKGDDDLGRGFYADPNEDILDGGQESSSLTNKRGEQSALQRPRRTHTRDGSHVSFSFETQEYFEDEPFPSQRQYFSPRRGNIGGVGHGHSHAALSPSRAVASPRRHYHSALSPIIKTPATPNHRWGASSFDHGLQPETPGAILAAIETPNPHRTANNGGPLLGLNVPLIADQRTYHDNAEVAQDGADADVSTEEEEGDEEEEEEEEEKVEIPEELKLASQKANDAAFDEMLRKSPENWTIGYGSDSEGELPSELPPSPARKKKKRIRPRPQKSTKEKKPLPRLPPPPASLLRPSPKEAAARSGLGSASFDEAVALAQREADHNIYSQIDNFLSNELVSRGSFDERSRTLNSVGSADVDANNGGGLEGGSSEQQHQSQQHKPLQHGSSSSRIGHARQGDLRSGVESFRTGDKVYARFNKDGGWYPATVQSIIVSPHTEEKLFSVRFDDGETASHLPRACLCSLQDYHGQQACESNYRQALSRRDTNQGPERRAFREPRARIRIGHINGVSEGHCYSRRSLFMAGAHQSDIHWINGDAHQGCDSIILTKPRPSRNEDDCLAWLKCEAGLNNGGCALTTSLHRKNPIRVFRSSMQKDNQYAPPLTPEGFHSCRYDGLYYVARMFDSRGGEANQMPLRGDTRCTFLIRRIPPKQEEQRVRESWGDEDMYAVPNAQEFLNEIGVHALLQLIQRSRGQSDKAFQHRTPNATRSPAFGNRSTIRSGSRSSRSRSGSRGVGPTKGFSFDPFAGITIRTDREISMDVRAGMDTARHANRGPTITSHSGRLMSPRFNDVQDGVGNFDPSPPHSVLSGTGSHTPMSLGALTPLNHSIGDNSEGGGSAGAADATGTQEVGTNTTGASSSWMTTRYYSDSEHTAEHTAGHTEERTAEHTAEHGHEQHLEKPREEDDEDEKMHEM